MLLLSGESAFWNCNLLSTVSFGNNLTTIERNAFSQTALTSITIPNSVLHIRDGAFLGCTELNNVTLGNQLIDISISADLTYGGGTFSECTSLETITIPSSVTDIGFSTFYDCSSLTSIVFENTSGWSASCEYVADLNVNSVDVTNPSQNVILFRDTYDSYNWSRN